jgi:hypothetical protein
MRRSLLLVAFALLLVFAATHFAAQARDAKLDADEAMKQAPAVLKEVLFFPQPPSRLVEVLGNMATLLTLAASRALPKSGPFPPPALPGFVGTTSLSATPHGPACLSRASGWEDALPPLGLPVLHTISLCRHAVATTPAGSCGMTSFKSPHNGGLR